MVDLDVLEAEEIYEFLSELHELEDYMDFRISVDLIDAIAGNTCGMRESRYANI